MQSSSSSAPALLQLFQRGQAKPSLPVTPLWYTGLCWIVCCLATTKGSKCQAVDVRVGVMGTTFGTERREGEEGAAVLWADRTRMHQECYQ